MSVTDTVSNERTNQYKRIRDQLKLLADYYQERGVYNTYWYYYNNPMFNKFWRRKDFRTPLARTMARARKSGLLKAIRSNSTCSSKTTSAKAP